MPKVRPSIVERKIKLEAAKCFMKKAAAEDAKLERRHKPLRAAVKRHVREATDNAAKCDMRIGDLWSMFYDELLRHQCVERDKRLERDYKKTCENFKQ